MKSKYALWFLTMSCFILIIVNGFQGNIHFKIDSLTIGLLVLAFLPFLQQIVGSIKAGEVEIEFREYSQYKQILIFLDGISSFQEWTFYIPRPGEKDLGLALKKFIDDLVKNNRRELTKHVNKWFKSENNNHKWFASEIVGYAKLDKFKDVCKVYFEGLNINETWENWQLNCLWAYSRFYRYEPLISKLQETLNENNKNWIIGALKQMIAEEKDIHLLDALKEATNKVSNQSTMK